MKFAIAKEHLDFFYQHRHIEFENLLSEQEVDTLKKSLFETLAKRLNSREEKLKNHNFSSLYMAGFDTWRDSDTIKKILLRPQLAEIASNLVKKKPLRMGFDQALYIPQVFHESKENMPPLFKKETSLASTSCLQGIVCGLILHLDAPAVPTESSELSIEEDVQKLIPIPKQAGSGIFFSPDTPLSLEHLMSTPGTCQILIAYTTDISLYRLCEDDPHTHTYKKMGYVFGDRLKNTSHPLVFRG
ncbi:hypothetical protein [Simkania sp.]|uniref:hypothetical protein n=1 Tax=Simkania sp. TaxID=34094 RepID=UPI003B51E0B0